MEGTRKSLAEKLGEVESIIQEKVKVAGDSVTSIVDEVKEFGSTVNETVTSAKETLKETFNFRKHIEEHPWVAVSAAVAAGVAGGIFLGPSRASASSAASYQPSYSSPPPQASGHSKVPEVVTTVLHNLKGLAIGSLMSLAQDLVSQNAPPSWKDHLTGMVDDLCVQLTGEKPSHFVQKSAEEQAPQQGATGEGNASHSDGGWTGSANAGGRFNNSGAGS